MRILIAGTTYRPALNGQAVFTTNLAEGLAARDHDVAVLFPEPRALSFVENGVRLEPVRSLDLSFIHTESYLPVFFGRVGRVFDEFSPEVVHIQDHYPLSVVVAREARKRGIPIIGTNHYSPASLEPYLPRAAWLKPFLDRVLWWWMLRLYRRLDYVTAPSPAAVNLLRQQGLRVPAQAVSCGTDLGRFFPDPKVDRSACRRRYGLDPDRKIILYVGRIDQEKRIDVLLHAFHLLHRDDAQLGIAGQGAALNQLQRMAGELKLGEGVRFTGPVRNEDLNQLLNSVDVFAMAGEAESLSIASLEAMASGKPMLLADAFALPQLVNRGVNGYLFKSGDPQDAAHYMELLLNQSDRWIEMGRASMEQVRPHSLEQTLERYTTLYVQLLEGAPLLEPAPTPTAANRGAEIAHRTGRP
jgi:1,2-diacylglycerol 3-alpha-glucosyltransferase